LADLNLIKPDLNSALSPKFLQNDVLKTFDKVISQPKKTTYSLKSTSTYDKSKQIDQDNVIDDLTSIMSNEDNT
jgi:hypothetical protein